MGSFEETDYSGLMVKVKRGAMSCYLFFERFVEQGTDTFGEATCLQCFRGTGPDGLTGELLYGPARCTAHVAVKVIIGNDLRRSVAGGMSRRDGLLADAGRLRLRGHIGY